MPLRFVVIAIFASIFSASCAKNDDNKSENTKAKAEVNVYSARKEALIKPLLDKFTAQSGIAVNLVTGKGDALLTRLKSESENTPADLLITTDVGRLERAKEAGVLKAVNDAVITNSIPATYRDSAGFWYGLSLRSRVIVFNPEKVQASELSTYTQLADSKWKGRICIRSSSNIYNQSLVSSLIAHNGLATTEAWLKALVANFARPPQGGDRDQIRAVAAGQCDLAVVNSYYLGAMLNSSSEKDVKTAQKVTLFWPNQGQNARGTHMNISGAGVTKHAKNTDAAIALIRFLASDSAQQWYGEKNNEYPVRFGIEPSETLKAWGAFKADALAVDQLAKYNKDAVKAMDRAGWK